MTEAGISHLRVVQDAIHPDRRQIGSRADVSGRVANQPHDGVTISIGGGKTTQGDRQVPRCMGIKKDGDRCKRPATKGSAVCTSHDAALTNPNVNTRAAANVRLAALVDPAISVLTKIMADDTARNSDRIKAADSILDRAGMGRHIGWMDDAASAKDILIQRLIERQNEMAMAATAPSPRAVESVIDADIVED